MELYRVMIHQVKRLYLMHKISKKMKEEAVQSIIYFYLENRNK